MDIFSAGCVIAELYSEKTAFTRSDMLAFSEPAGRERLHVLLEFVPEEDGLRAMVSHMLQLEPSRRGTSEQVSPPQMFTRPHSLLLPTLAAPFS
jgi:phosphoinositide-3-kinase regulatory subunit 4